jgi:hypothetical protein
MRSDDWLFKVVDEASERVEKWPQWKRDNDSKVLECPSNENREISQTPRTRSE